MSAADCQTIHLHREAPPKPALGADCNGCGVCCAVAPCPIGMVISRRRTGRCAALVWQDSPPRYVCGVLSRSTRKPGTAPAVISAWVRALAARSIGAGIGCDADIDVPLL